MRKALATDGDLACRQQLNALRQQRLKRLAEVVGIQGLGEFQIHPLALGLSTEGQCQSDLNPRQWMKPTGEADRKRTATQGPLEHAHQIKMAEQRHRSRFGELHPDPAHPVTGRRLGRHLGWHLRSGNHHVVPEIRAADPTTAATIKGAVGHNRRCQSPLQIVRQPGFVDAGVDVIPGERLSTERFQILPIQRSHSTPAPHLHLPVTPLQAGIRDGSGPGGVGAIQRLEPGIHAGTGPPGRLDHRGKAPIAAAHKILHGRKPHIGEIHLHAAQTPEGLLEQHLAPLKLSRGDAVPLKRGVGLGREIADRDVQVQPTQVTAALLEHHAGLGNAENIGIRLTGEADHEVQLHLAVSVLHGRADAMQQVVIGEALVDDVAESLCPGLRGEGETRFPRAAKDVGNVFIEAIHPLAGQLKRDVLIRQAVAQLHPHRRQRQIVAAAQGEQREIAVAGLFHAGLHCLDHSFGFHIPSRSRQHSGLAEATTPGATAANLHRETVMHRFHMGHETHGVVGHWRRHTAKNPCRDIRMKRLEGDPIGARSIERRHVNAGNLGQIPQQLRSRQSIRFGLRHHQTDFGQQLLTVTQSDEVEKRGIGLWIAGGGGPTSENQRRCCRITQGQVAPISGADGHLRQIQHLKDVGGAQFVTEAETQDVEGRQRPTAFHGKQRLGTFPQAACQISRWKIGAITQLPGDGIEDRIENDVAQVAGANLIDLGVGERPANRRCLPVPWFNP